MDSIEVAKVSAALLVAGIACFLTGVIGANIVHQERPAKPAIEIKSAEPEAAAAAPAADKLTPIGPLLASAHPAAGEATFKQLCTSCHNPPEGGKARVGPNLYGVVGAPHGHMEGGNYSPRMKASS